MSHLIHFQLIFLIIELRTQIVCLDCCIEFLIWVCSYISWLLTLFLFISLLAFGSPFLVLPIIFVAVAIKTIPQVLRLLISPDQSVALLLDCVWVVVKPLLISLLTFCSVVLITLVYSRKWILVWEVFIYMALIVLILSM